MMLAASGPILSAWIVLPVVTVAMLLVAGHTLAIQRVAMPASRRRIRTANGLLMLVALPLLAYALCVIGPQDKRLFVLVWVSVMGLVGLVIVLALLDVVNNVRLFARERGQIDRMTAQALAERFRQHGAGEQDGR